MTKAQRDTVARYRYEAREHRAQRQRLLLLAHQEPNPVQRLRYRFAANERLQLAKQADRMAAQARVAI